MKIVNRQEWGARPASRITTFNGPAREVYVHHGAGSTPATVEGEKAELRGYQSFHMGKGWSDIAYNFAVGQSGTVYEGRGWDRVGGGTGSPQDAYSYSVVAIGNFETATPSTALVDGYIDLIAYGIETGRIVADAPIFGDRDVNSTACPGRNLYSRLDQIRRGVAAADKTNEEDDDDMSLTVTNLRTGETGYRAGEEWAVRFVQQVLSLPAVGTYNGPKNGKPSAVLDKAVADAKGVLLGREDASPTMGADLWRAIVAQGAQLPLEPAIVPGDCREVEAELAACRGVVAAQKLAIQRAGQALAEAP